jgi:hypothetical protein
MRGQVIVINYFLVLNLVSLQILDHTLKSSFRFNPPRKLSYLYQKSNIMGSNLWVTIFKIRI